ncbi:undecaprenyl-phosphate galactose phosphotransferase WbaP [Nitratidesulfovibrio sp. 1201_IL3209]|uniref:undecaprenyl-phosphate galactose phosphotransferase WbaP n=1 Tax=Nitratidesulfovibrio sp. 1201_IL3209 TaxID=3084053 RepID=UPI002FD9A532
MTLCPVQTAPWRTTLLLVLTDTAVIIGVTLAATLLRDIAGRGIQWAFYPQLLPFLLLLPLFNVVLGLYASITLPPPQELKKLTLGATLAFLCAGSFIFFAKGGERYSRVAFLLAWLGCVVALPLCRHWLRGRFAGQPWWGVPAVILGGGAAAAEVVRTLRARPMLGLRPVACVAPEPGSAPGSPDAPDSPDGEDCGLACCASDAEAVRLYPHAYALLLLDSFEDARARQRIVEATALFRNVLIMPHFSTGGARLWVSAMDIGGLLGLLVRQNLLDANRVRLKRAIDLLLTLGSAVVVLPLILAIAVWIRVDSPGSPFFTQRRIGQNGREMRILKFRTMIRDAECVLRDCLSADPDLRAEWERDQKLKCDPRITRAGAFLRKTSLDELPQLWNVLKGEMSLVGPRPIVEAEVEKYGEVFDLYTRVKPGITGLWQVSGRNDVSYPQRVEMDRYYICNWSVWFDIWILAKTVPVVLQRNGAY